MRWSGRIRMGYFPLPLSEAQRIRKFLLFPDRPSSALDPRVGDGRAFEAITNGAEVLRYGIELDAFRAEQARQRIPNIVQGNMLDVQCPVEHESSKYHLPPCTMSSFELRLLSGLQQHHLAARQSWRLGVQDFTLKAAELSA
jgi:hypothetical protein